MLMDKRFLVLGLLLIFASSAFAAGLNSLTSFNVGWDASSNQLIIHSTCIGTTQLEVMLTGGKDRLFTCSAVDLGQTWFLGDQSDVSEITALGMIGGPCSVCHREVKVNLANGSTPGEGLPLMWIFIIGLIIVILIVVGVVRAIGYFINGGQQPQQ